MENDAEGSTDAGQTADELETPQDTMIPKERLDAVLGKVANLEAEVQRLAGANEVLTRQPVSAPTVHSRAELVAKVEAGEMSAEDAQEQLDQRTADSVASVVEQRLVSRQRESSVETDMAAYIARHPDLHNNGSKTFSRVQQEFRYLTETLGSDPKAATTQLAAVRSVLGPLDGNTTLTIKTETAQEGYSGQGDTPSQGGSKNKLNKDERAYYEKVGVGPGKLYKNWAEVEEMVGIHGDPNLRERFLGRH
jgi:hypothetical protein